MPLKALAIAFAAVVALALVGAVAIMSRGYVRAVKYWEKYQSARFPRALLSDVVRLPEEDPGGPQRHLKTGDILLFIPFAHGFFNSMLTDDVFSHAAMVVDIDGTLHTSEATQGTELGAAGHAAPGADTIPLLARLKYYSGIAHVMQLSRFLSAAAAAAVRAAAAARHPYPTVGQIAAGAFGGRPAARHCFQHVAHLLKVAGLIDLTDAGFADISRRITGLSGSPLLSDAVYGPVRQLLYDIDAV